MVDRRGVVMLKFIPAIGERKYDWEKKQVISLTLASYVFILIHMS